MLSHPTRGAWIETYEEPAEEPEPIGRTPHGVRGLKLRIRLFTLK